MLVSLLLCERMEVNECILLIGCRKYCAYAGYGRTFQFRGDFHDRSPRYFFQKKNHAPSSVSVTFFFVLYSRDDWGRIQSYLVAMDAIFFPEPSQQYDMNYINRELDKAFCSFHVPPGGDPAEDVPIATGHWGCGAFNGDRQLKGMLIILDVSEK